MADVAAMVRLGVAERAEQIKDQLVAWLEQNTSPADESAVAVALLEMGVSLHVSMLGQADAMDLLRWMFTPPGEPEPDPDQLPLFPDLFAEFDAYPEASYATH